MFRQPLTIICLIGSLLIGFGSTAQNKSYPFKQGEKMIYSVHFGWFNIGKAEIRIDPKLRYEEGVPHYFVKCTINSSPWFRMFKQMNMTFESMIRVDNLRPKNSFRDLKQGKKIDIRYDDFYFEDSIRVEAYIEDIDKHRHHKFAYEETPFFDALSTYLYLRNKDLSNAKENFGVRTFFTNTLYEFYIEPDGKGKYKLDGKKIPTSEFELVFPPSDLNPKGKSGYVAISADDRKIPLKFKVNLSVGSFALSLDEVAYE